MDVWWFRLPRERRRPATAWPACSAPGTRAGRHRSRRLLPVRVRHPEGPRRRSCARSGIEALHRGVVALVPWLAGRVEALTSFDDVKLLDVQLNRLQALVRRRAAADRRRRARDVTGRRGRHQPGGRRRGRGGPDPGRPAARRTCRTPATGPASRPGDGFRPRWCKAVQRLVHSRTHRGGRFVDRAR